MGSQASTAGCAGDTPDGSRATDACRPNGRGGARGKYDNVDGDLPGAAEYLRAARTDVPAQAVDAFPDTCIMHVNIQGLRSHLAELSAVIRLSASTPDIVCINETFLDYGVEEIDLEGFDVVGRRDRSYNGDKRRCGGVIVYAKSEIADHVTLLQVSEVSERLWFQLHTNNGPYLLCAWYRPPVQGEVQTIESFEAELGQLRGNALGMMLLGDINLHSKRWLSHSASSDMEGELMRHLCLKMGLRQIVRGPTRGNHLLDLCITDIESATASVSEKTADHAIVTSRLNLGIPQTVGHRWKVWSYLKADWDIL